MSELLEYLHKALESPLGVVVRTNDPERLRARFYKARTEAMNPAFEALTIQPSKASPATELWIVKRPPQ